jgi:hypothetical protein
MKHQWQKKPNGQIDTHAYTNGEHHGPKCTVCGYTFCPYCRDDYDTECFGGPAKKTKSAPKPKQERLIWTGDNLQEFIDRLGAENVSKSGRVLQVKPDDCWLNLNEGDTLTWRFPPQPAAGDWNADDEPPTDGAPFLASCDEGEIYMVHYDKADAYFTWGEDCELMARSRIKAWARINPYREATQ